MTMNEYIEELKFHLRKLPNDDREDAIAYYFEYLAETGPDGEAEAIERLGTPAQLAAGIRADAALEALEQGASGQQIAEVYGDAGGTAPAGKQKAPGVGQGVQAVWLSVLGAIPRTALAGFVAGLVIIIVFAVLIALFAVAAALMVAGGGAIALGLTVIGPELATGLVYVGGGLIAIPAGWFLWRFVWWVWRHAWRGIARMFNGIRRKREVRRGSK